MSAVIKPAPVRKSLTVNAAPARAFEVFTDRFDSWWPRSHTIGAAPLKKAVIEPGAGGRWLGVDENGAVDLWGEVLVWDPPHRVVLAWRIGVDWKYDPSLLTEVEVTFTAQSGGGTLVTLEHRLLENMGEAGESARQTFEAPNGWSGLLAAYAAAVG
jgi:uncharacterized protein YndB with AHSA1/START domain